MVDKDQSYFIMIHPPNLEIRTSISTCSRYPKLWFCLLITVAIRPKVAHFSCLHLWKCRYLKFP